MSAKRRRREKRLVDRALARVGAGTGVAPDSVLNAMRGKMRVQPPARTMAGILAAYGSTPLLKAVIDRLAWGVGMIPFQMFAVRRNGQFVRDLRLQTAPHELRAQLLEAALLAGEMVEQSPAHPGLQAIDGGPLLIGMSLRTLTQVYLECVGEALWVKERDALGVWRGSWPLPPHWVVDQPRTDRPSYEVRWRDVHAFIPTADMVRFVYPDPLNPFGRGLGTGFSLTDEIDGDDFASKHAAAELYNGAVPEMIITADGLSQSDTERLEEKWLGGHQGVLKSHLPLFLSRKVEVEKLSQDFASLQLVDFRKYNGDVFQQTYGLPPELVGKIINSSRNSFGASDYINARHNLVPRMEYLRLTLQQEIIREYDERLVLSYVNPVNADNEFQLRAKSYAPWAPEVNEWRKTMGLPEKPEYTGLHFIAGTGTFAPIHEGTTGVGPVPAQPQPNQQGAP